MSCHARTWLAALAAGVFVGSIADPNSAGIIHTQVVADASPQLMADFKQAMGAEMGFFSRQYYNATQIMFPLTADLLKRHDPIAGSAERTIATAAAH